MGKVRKLRQKYHASKRQRTDSQLTPEPTNPLQGGDAHPNPLVDQIFTTDTLMSNRKITSQLLKSKFADFEERNTIVSTLSAKSSTYAGMKKKTKKDLRHQLWLQKVDIVQKSKEEAQIRKKKQKAAIIGDTSPLMDALSSIRGFLTDVAAERTSQAGIEAKYKPIKKQKTRQREQIKNASLMNSVIGDPYYQANPFSAIQEHLRLKFNHPKETQLLDDSLLT